MKSYQNICGKKFYKLFLTIYFIKTIFVKIYYSNFFDKNNTFIKLVFIINFASTKPSCLRTSCNLLEWYSFTREFSNRRKHTNHQRSRAPPEFSDNTLPGTKANHNSWNDFLIKHIPSLSQATLLLMFVVNNKFPWEFAYFSNFKFHYCRHKKH